MLVALMNLRLTLDRINSYQIFCLSPSALFDICGINARAYIQNGDQSFTFCRIANQITYTIIIMSINSKFLNSSSVHVCVLLWKPAVFDGSNYLVATIIWVNLKKMQHLNSIVWSAWKWFKIYLVLVVESMSMLR